jgi:GntR family transcriptional regulator, transcriptional repressor for pyruvate dehydrogenase complex
MRFYLLFFFIVILFVLQLAQLVFYYNYRSMNFKLDNRSSTLVDKVEMSILDYIKVNKLIPGDTLPNELMLSSELGISRNILREALSRLKMLGIIQSRTKKGIIIQEPSLVSAFEKVIYPYLLSENTIVEMMGMRIILEIGITEFLFKNLDAVRLGELERIVLSQKDTKYQLTVEQETEFHKKIYEITENNFVLQFQKIIHPVFEFAVSNYESYFAPVNRRLVNDGEIVTHQNLFDFIKAGDIEGYRKAIKLHLQPYMEFIKSKS